MDCSAIPRILEELNLKEECVANIYHHGSWVYGSNTPTSDRDLIIVTRSSNQKPLKFIDSIDYFHEFELHKLWNEYDVCVYSVDNFEKLLEKNYLCSVQCIFLPDEFKIKAEIDFQTTYLNKYYNILRLKQVACYEMSTDLGLYESNNFSKHSTCSSRSIQTSQSRKDYVFKNLFHGLRYLDFVEQLIRTRSIHDFKRATYLFDEMKEIRGDSTDDSSMER
jgi:predicted nucleotidyltransferase